MNEQLLGSPNLELLRANAVRDAESSGATKIMHGTITRRGTRFHVEARMEDAKTHKIDAALVSDGSLLQALSALSAKISPGRREFSTTNEEAAAAWGHGD